MADKTGQNWLSFLKNKTFQTVLGLAVLVVVIVLLAKSGNDTNENNTNTEDTLVNTPVITPVIEGETTYDFSGVTWEFDTTDASVPEGHTWVKMRFTDFTKNGVEISFGKPYKLGFHQGICTESPFIDTTGETGIPFAYVTCATADSMRQIVVLQENETVVVKYRDVATLEEVGSFSTLYTVDVTDIVKS